MSQKSSTSLVMRRRSESVDGISPLQVFFSQDRWLKENEDIGFISAGSIEICRAKMSLEVLRKGEILVVNVNGKLDSCGSVSLAHSSFLRDVAPCKNYGLRAIFWKQLIRVWLVLKLREDLRCPILRAKDTIIPLVEIKDLADFPQDLATLLASNLQCFSGEFADDSPILDHNFIAISLLIAPCLSMHVLDDGSELNLRHEHLILVNRVRTVIFRRRGLTLIFNRRHKPYLRQIQEM